MCTTHFRSRASAILVVPVSCLLACGTNVTNIEDHRYVDAVPADAGADDAAPTAAGVPITDTPPEALNVDVFGVTGVHYWFVVSDAEVERMNERFATEHLLDLVDTTVDELYWPGEGLGSDATFVDRLVVSTPGAGGHSADFGKVHVRLSGKRRQNRWTPQTLPDLSVDTDHFTPGTRVGGLERLHFHGAVTSDIFRERLVMAVYAKLGYPAPRTNHAWVSSSVWAPEIAVPYVVVESYGQAFCEQRDALGVCVNLWGFVGDLGQGEFAFPGNCQLGSCDPARALAMEREVRVTPLGAGYKAALEPWFDWGAFHQAQCLSWILAVATDGSRTSGSHLVIAERADGKFQYLPSEVDFSLGHMYGGTVLLPGYGTLATGCQSDPQCWADTIDTCEGLLSNFAGADPVGLLNGLYAELETEGMLRVGDEVRYGALVSYLERRLAELPVELELNRPAPYFDCQDGLVRCGRECRVPGYCVLCEPAPDPLPATVLDAGAPDAAVPPEEVPAEPIDCVPPLEIPRPL